MAGPDTGRGSRRRCDRSQHRIDAPHGGAATRRLPPGLAPGFAQTPTGSRTASACSTNRRAAIERQRADPGRRHHRLPAADDRDGEHDHIDPSEQPESRRGAAIDRDRRHRIADHFIQQQPANHHPGPFLRARLHDELTGYHADDPVTAFIWPRTCG